MKEREEFSLPPELERVLATPLEQELPEPDVLARRAITLGKRYGATRTEKTIYTVGAALGVLAVARIVTNWWEGVKATAPGSVDMNVLQMFAAHVDWIVVASASLAGAALVGVSYARRARVKAKWQ